MTGDERVPKQRPPSADQPLLSLGDYEQAAQAALPVDVWDFIAGGSGTETTLHANPAAFSRLALRPRVLVDVTHCDPATELLGATLAAPIGVAPTAYHRLAHPDGELATARAAAANGLLYVVSFFASVALEEIAAASAGGPLWLQLYWFRRREILAELVNRAESAGYRALVLTVDVPRIGRRLRDLRHGFALPPQVTAANLDPTLNSATQQHRLGESAIANHAQEHFDTTISWRDLAWLREQTRLPVVIKGVLTAEDAELAVSHGAAAVVVSNHGGRQLDGAMPSLSALPEVVTAVAGRVPVLVDGGVRTGSDVLKALALGADTVLVGRPVLWGLAADGEPGVRDVLEILRTELEDAMVLCGRPNLADLDGSLVRPLPG